jgi:hypothetical protein
MTFTFNIIRKKRDKNRLERDFLCGKVGILWKGGLFVASVPASGPKPNEPNNKIYAAAIGDFSNGHVDTAFSHLDMKPNYKDSAIDKVRHQEKILTDRN